MQALPAEHLPVELRQQVQRNWEQFLDRALTAGVAIEPIAESLGMEIATVWACSDFVAKNCIKLPDLLSGLIESGDLERRYPEGAYAERLGEQLGDCADEASLSSRLRRFRRREMVRIAWRDLAGKAELDEVLTDTSALADACIDQALERLDTWQHTEWGVPTGDLTGAAQSMVVLGMGKLGARELNFSSDVDLIFAYPEAGQTVGPGRERTNEQYFVRLGQRLIRVLDEQTHDGYVFRVDMRLRPYGDTGPLAMSFAAMEAYYQSQGREWERYAMIKARIVAGDSGAGAQVLDLLRPFVYRRYLDFGAFESLREMKQMIVREVQRKGLAANVKLGSGGIREIEFIGQAFQLIRGGREPALRIRPIQNVLTVLAENKLLPNYAADELRAAYRFLRRVENRLQERADQQVHSLPEDDEGRAKLAYAMGYSRWLDLARELQKHRDRVAAQFERVFAAPQGEEAEASDDPWSSLWQGSLGDDDALRYLAQSGYQDATEALRLIGALRQSHACRSLSDQGRNRLDRLMPLLLGAVAGCENSDVCLPRLLSLIEAIARRTAYLSLLIEHPMALSQLVKLAAASPWIARLLSRHPLLLDELLDPRTLYQPAKREQLDRELTERLATVAQEDLEQQMEVLRLFKQANELRVAAADVAGVMPLMVVSDHLTWIAEAVLGQVLRLAWEQVSARHGEPYCTIDDVRRCAGFAILAYGKLGGLELGYGSDLDIVFLHDSVGSDQHTDGAKSVENNVFFARLGQRIIHLLSTATPLGVLYEVDTRLRPSGASGLLVSSIDAFADYQRSEAWTWEHQALTRARLVAGDPAIGERFTNIRAEVLAHPRDPEQLRNEVREMRQKMRDQLGSGEGEVFDLKQDAGGIADIEFIVQFLVLRWAARYPSVYFFTDNIRQLEALAKEGVLAAEDAGALMDIYRSFRKRIHQLKLQEVEGRVGGGEYSQERDQVLRFWQQIIETP